MKRPLAALLTIYLVTMPFIAQAAFHTSFITIFQKNKDSVVSITVTEQNLPGMTPERTRGSGFVWTSDGFIITAAHLFENVKDISVDLGPTTYTAKLIGLDKPTDIAVIKINTNTQFTPVTLGNSDQLAIGEWICAIGDPFGFKLSITHGIVAGEKRNINGFLDEFIQNDAAINPGNSGGPLFNMRGEVVGINTLIGDGNNIAFTVPINLIKYIAQQLKQNGKVVRTSFGASLEDFDELSQSLIRQLGITPQALSKKEGVVVTGVASNSPAARAGMQPGDIIRAYNGIPISSSLPFVRFVRFQVPGSTLSLTIERQERQFNTHLTVIQMNDEEIPSAREEIRSILQPRH